MPAEQQSLGAWLRCHNDIFLPFWHNAIQRKPFMPAELPTLDQLPRQSASHVKNKWRDVLREVRATGSVAITNHSAVEMVLVDAAVYEQLTANAAMLKAHETSVLDQLAAEFDQRLAVLQHSDAAGKVAEVFAGKGKLVNRPKAGTAF
jgi:prevent-host-death family protein